MFLVCYSSACGSFIYMLFADNPVFVLVGLGLIIFCIYDLLENIKIHALRKTPMAICQLSFNNGWWMHTNAGQCDKVSIKRRRSICFGKIVLLCMEGVRHKQVVLLLVGEVLSDDDWRRLHKYLKIYTL